MHETLFNRILFFNTFAYFLVWNYFTSIYAFYLFCFACMEACAFHLSLSQCSFSTYEEGIAKDSSQSDFEIVIKTV